MESERKIEQNNREEPLSVLTRSLTTGFIGGIVWGTLGIIMYFFNFSEVVPRSYLLRSWTTAEWTSGWLGHVTSVLMMGVISLLVAFIYHGLFKKVNSLWMGAVYGILLWFIVFYILQPVFPNVPNLVDLNSYTIVSTLCLFLLYGTFIGYSISFDYNDKTRNGNEVEG